MGKYVFRQSVDLLPHRVFDRIVEKYQGNKYVRSFTCWNQLLVMMFAQLIGCGSLRELILFCTAHKAKTKWLGFGDISVSRSNLSKANQQRDDNILFDQRIRLTTYMAKKRYPAELRRIGFYKYRRTFVYLTNNWEICAKDVALLYKYRWQVELFFKWLKQHLQIKKFWGTSENAARIQIYTAISAYCLVATAEHDYGLDRSIFDVLCVVSNSLLDTMPIRELFGNLETEKTICDDTQLQFDFDFKKCTIIKIEKLTVHFSGH